MADFSYDQKKILNQLFDAGVLSTSGNAWIGNLEYLCRLGYVKSTQPSRGAVDLTEWSLTDEGKKLVMKSRGDAPDLTPKSLGKMDEDPT